MAKKMTAKSNGKAAASKPKKIGAAGKVRTKGEFHINEEYPTKFAASTAPGVTYATPKLARTTQPEVFALKPCASGKDNCTLELTVKFTPEQSGTVSVGGELSVGVCNKDNCLFEKKALALSVPVS